MRTELPTGTVTFLFTDIAGSTRLLRRLGPQAYAVALAEHRFALREAMATYGGVEVDAQGDALFMAFSTAAAAAAAAAAGQAALDAGLVSVRMGLHTGTPVVAEGGYVGLDVHRGARVAALAAGGQVLLTEATAQLLPQETVVADLGLHRLKDFEGPTRVLQLGGGDFPDLRTPGAVDLPVPATAFVGREREMFAAVSLWLDQQPRVLTVVGAGGAGKTRFALELARLLAEDADGGTVFVPLASLRDGTLVLPTVADRLGAASPEPSAVAAQLRDRRTHLVLDNLEHLVTGASRSLATLVAAAPSLRVIATSREPLHLSGEIEFDLPPLSETDAVSLFLARARAVRPDVSDTPATRALVHALEGLPLALELAAARVKLLNPEQIHQRVQQQLDLFRGPRDAEARHSTLRATIAWSHDLLDDAERLLFARLAVFRGGCTLEAAEAVCEADVDTLFGLLDKSLLRRREEESGTDRFWMFESVRTFAREQLDASGHGPAVQASLLAYLTQLARARSMTDAPDHAVPALIPEVDNVRSVLEWAVQHDPVGGLSLAVLLEQFWVIRTPEEGAGWLQRLREAVGEHAPLPLVAASLRSQAGALGILGETDRPAQLYAQSIRLFDEAGEDQAAGEVRLRALINRFNAGDSDGIAEEAIAVLERAEMTGDRKLQVESLGLLGDLAVHSGDLARAADLICRSADRAAELGWRWWQSHQLIGLAMVRRRRGDVSKAAAAARRALGLALGTGDRMVAIYSVAELAAASSLAGDVELSGRLWGAIEAEEELAAVAQWPAERADYLALLPVTDARFEAGRASGRLLTLGEAASGEAMPGPAPC